MAAEYAELVPLVGVSISAGTAAMVYFGNKRQKASERLEAKRDEERKALAEEIKRNRDDILAELRSNKEEHDECKAEQRKCQRNLDQNFRTHKDAEKSWAEQGEINKDLYEKQNKNAIEIAKIKTVVGAR